MTTVGDCVARFDQWFPPELAQDWDAVGLLTGRRSNPVTVICFAVDITAATVDWAIGEGAQLLFVHHPLYLRGTTNLDGDSPKGALVHRAITNDLAILVAHTNADIARPGVTDAIAHALGLRDLAPIRPHASNPEIGLGRVGDLVEPCDFATLVRSPLGRQSAATRRSNSYLWRRRRRPAGGSRS
jgi:putative NIF3 family GTP cyclohydrolase 1 type 2